jgi:ferric-dicitrate binding protein FerR (iron transport regulator)
MLRASGGDLSLAADDDPDRRPWARTELVIDLAPPPAPAPARAAASRTRGWVATALRRRGRVAAAIAGVASLALLVAIGWRMGHRATAESQRAPASRARDDTTVVSAVAGTLQRRGAAGEWAAVTVGDRLAPDDVLRTPPGSTATLAVGDRSRIALSDATQLTVREITAAVQRLRLSRGRISVDHQPDGARVMIVETERGDAEARAGAARFSALSTGASLAVATEAGVVRLENDRGSVEVKEGEQAVAFRGAAPSRPAPIPRRLLLRLANAAAAAPPALCAVVEGTVRPGTEVRVDGQRVDPGPDGRFTQRVDRRRGVTSVAVVTREVSGAVVERRVDCAAIDPRLQDFAVRWGTQ